MKPIPLSPFLKGLIASNQILAQPKGSIARDSNLIYTERGALVTCDGTEILNWFDGAIQGPDAPVGPPGPPPTEKTPAIYSLGDATGFPLSSSQSLTCVAPNDMPVGDVIIFSVHCFQFPPGGTVPVINSVSDDLGSTNIWIPVAPEQSFLNDHSPPTTSKVRIFYTVLTQDIPNGSTFHLTANYSVGCGTESLDSVGTHNLVTTPDQVVQQVFNCPTGASLSLAPTTVDEVVFWFQGLFAGGAGFTLPTITAGSTFPFFPITGGQMMAIPVGGGGVGYITPPGTYMLTWSIGSNNQNGVTVVTFKVVGA